MRKSFAYVVYLFGKYVYTGHSNQCIIRDLHKLDDVIKEIGNKYNIRFIPDPRCNNGSMLRSFINTTDDRDISLFVELVHFHK